MTLTIKRPDRTFTQSPIAVVWGNPDELHYIDSNGEYRSGNPEEIWQELAMPQPVQRRNIRRGQSYMSRSYQKYVVVTPHKGSIKNLIRTCDARHWTGITKGSGKYHTLTHTGGPTIHRLYHDEHPEEVAKHLFAYADFLNSHGCVFRSTVTGGGLSLFKTTLDKPIKLWAPPEITEAFWPGRAEYFYDRYQLFWNMAYYDLKQAYPTALSSSPLPARWHQTDPDKWREYPDGFSYAVAYVPPSDPLPHPLPKRLTGGKRQAKISYASGVISGWYPHRDLLAADELGYIVRVETTWIPDSYTEAFQSERWQELRQELRGLPGLAGRFGKEADNGLWGLLGFDSTKQRKVAWTDKDATDKGEQTIANINGTRQIHGLGIAVSATARVRQQLWQAMTATNAIYCATDGIICRPTFALDSQWILNEEMPLVAIKDSGCYAYYSESSPILQYKGGKERFDRHDGKAGYLEGDTETGTIPSMTMRELYKRGYMTDAS